MEYQGQDRRRDVSHGYDELARSIAELTRAQTRMAEAQTEVAKAQTVTAAGLADHLQYCIGRGKEDKKYRKGTDKWRKQSDRRIDKIVKLQWQALGWLASGSIIAVVYLTFYIITGHKP